MFGYVWGNNQVHIAVDPFVAYRWRFRVGAIQVASRASKQAISPGSPAIPNPQDLSTIVIKLKPEFMEFSDKDRIEEILKKYSNFVNFPITLNGSICVSGWQAVQLLYYAYKILF